MIFERFDGCQRRAREVWVHSVRRAGREGADKRFASDISIYANDGDPIAKIRGLSLKLIPPEIFGASPKTPGKLTGLGTKRSGPKFARAFQATLYYPDRRACRMAHIGGPGTASARGWPICFYARGDPVPRRFFADNAVVASLAIDPGQTPPGFRYLRGVRRKGRSRVCWRRMHWESSIYWSLDLPTGGMTVDQLESRGNGLFWVARSALLQAVVEPRQAWSAPPRLLVRYPQCRGRLA